ncbi:hypothetical protein PITCH_A1820006 [uncultured Desulfobacterium sp.]|uniref:Uncharacterized protein n=1 Tax=uncultured Desulfobacterium sp. TaxID=201089 RepID=A0A445MV45_9BACT|nr:hypothetical protein PITCH_A1820006 [uncultured Desulfobacterium sp.]
MFRPYAFFISGIKKFFDAFMLERFNHKLLVT